jgi:hypothetical protein
MTSPTVPLVDRLAARTDYGDGSGCWLWMGPTAPARRGYGHLAYRGKHLGAHRVAWELAHGRPVPAGMRVCHHCDQPRCIRPDHLFLGTQRDNMADAKRKGRVHLGEADGQAKLTAEAVPLIRARHRAGVRFAHLAREFGVTEGAIRQVVSRATWAHVP